MNTLEKLGLVVFLVGVNMLTSTFVLGGGDASAAMSNGESISLTKPIIFFVFGAIMFMIPSKKAA